MLRDSMRTASTEQSELAAATAKRRTFAIISHPDAGKTTLTEKLLLYSGLIRTAGMVRGRKGRQDGGLRLDGYGTGAGDLHYCFRDAVSL